MDFLIRSTLKSLIEFMGRLVADTGKVHPWILVLILFLGGVMFWGAFNWSLELSNTETFCISCHEMRDNIYPEYQMSSHYANQSGVRATCPDCHVPREWIDKVVRKVGATNELYHKLIGSIDTREKFLHKRMELAGYVWDAMQANDSLECRNCHEHTFMDSNRIKPISAHLRAQKEGITCIGCHMGIAHKLPAEFFDQVHSKYEEDGAECRNCHAQLNYAEGDWD